MASGPSLANLLQHADPTGAAGTGAGAGAGAAPADPRLLNSVPPGVGVGVGVGVGIHGVAPPLVAPIIAPIIASSIAPGVGPSSAPASAVSAPGRTPLSPPGPREQQQQHVALASPAEHDDATLTPPTSTSRGHANTSSLYQCADCKRRYSRPEHLARHIQTHTLGKRFFCQVCGKAFARADLLKRHAANHENDNDATKKRRRTTSEPGAGRVSHACRPCATARVKCEESKPCTRCRSRNLNCEYASSEAGSAAAMHLLHLSANAHHSSVHSGAPSVESSSPHAALDASPPAAYHSSHARPPPPPPVLTHNPAISPGLAQTSAVKPEEAQLPTPDTVMEQGQHEQFQQPFDASGGMVDMARLPFSDFLRDVLYEPALEARLAESQGLAVLDFCDDANLELNDMDFGILDNWNVDGMTGSAAAQEFTPRTDDTSVDLSQMRQSLNKIWADSPWRWHPKNLDTGYGEQSNLPVPTDDVSSPVFQERQRRLDRVVRDKLDPAGRDKILAIVLSTCRNNSMMTRVASSFPSVDVMDTLVHIFLASHLCQVSEWIHFGSFSLNSQWPEWLAVVAAGGAVLTPVQTLRKFGFAIQEAVRVTIPSRFEDNNTTINDLGLLQALILGQDIGLWSGNRRKMEIAECHLVIPITMMRYRAKFQRSAYPVIVVDPADEGDILEEKWKLWHQRESWKRLVFHCYLRDSQTSMTTLTNPSMSYSELTLPLPEARELWFAKSAAEWKMHYLDRYAGQSKRPPSIGDLFRDINLLSANHRRLDVQLSISIYLHGFWSLILEYRQLSAVHRSRSYSTSLGGNTNLVLSSRHQELCKDLQRFQIISSEWNEMLSGQESLVLNLLMMNLHVSLDDLQLFSGKEGEDQARRMYPVLQQWSESPEARQALWHAGQILGQAKQFPMGHLKDFYAVGVHHAALAFWTYGVVTKASRRQPIAASPFGYEPIYVDGPSSPAVHRFIGFGQGRAAIRGPATREGSTIATMEDPRACMEVAQEILKANFGQESLPPIVENLCQLIKQLGNAAWAVGLG